MLIETSLKRTLTRLHNGEHAGFGEESIEHLKEAAQKILAAKPDWDVYEVAVGHEAVMYKQSPESLETKDIAELDTDRDKYWREMLRRLKFQPTRLAENVRKAANFLLHIMNKYGNVPEANLLEETTNIRKAILEFKSPEAQAAIALIEGFGQLVDDIEAVNDTLHDLYDQRYMEREAIKELGKLEDYRKVVDNLFINFLDAVNAAHLINERGAKDPVIAAAAEEIRFKLAGLVAQLQYILDHRGHKTGGTQNPDITNPEVPGGDNGGDGNDGGDDNNGDGGDGNEGDTHNPDTTNPPIPPFIPDFE